MQAHLEAYAVGIIGTWLFSDGLYSIVLYLGRPGYSGPPQTWRRDHWIRVVRMALGMVLIGLGAIQ